MEENFKRDSGAETDGSQVHELKAEIERLNRSLNRFQVILDQSEDILFEWNIVEDTLLCSDNYRKKMGYIPAGQKIFEHMRDTRYILDADRTEFLRIMREILGGRPYTEAECRIGKADGSFIWCRIRATTQYGQDGKPIRALGVMRDIDREKRRSQKLMEKADKDGLTKLYNKAAVEAMVSGLLKDGTATGCSALLMIDVDNFKQVNDTRGHLFGDSFLMETAREIRKLFREDDVVGRIGGDEFLVFVRNIPGPQVAKNKAQQITDALRSLAASGGVDSFASCSVGIAVCPLHGQTFRELYRSADYALYEAKRRGKDQYVLCDKEMLSSQAFLMPQKDLSAIGGKIDSNTGAVLGQNMLVEFIFRSLSQSTDVEEAVARVLEIVGRRFDVSRVYIFEDTPDGNYCSNTFEWCNKGIDSQIGVLQQVSYENDIGSGYKDNFDENGIFYCRDIRDLSRSQHEILKRQGIKSVLQCAIRDNGYFRGFVGFDECRTNRFWTQEQIDALMFISEVVGTFLLKERSRKKLEQANRSMKEILDNQNSYIYVVDPDSMRLLFVNEKTRRLVPDAEPGQCCHRAFFHRADRCARCPAKDLNGKNNQTLEIYNPLLRVWTMADACMISWEGKEALLLACHDVTMYKLPSDEKMERSEKQPLVLRDYEAGDEEELSSLISRNLMEVNIADYPQEEMERIARLYGPEKIREYAKQRRIRIAQYGGVCAGTLSIVRLFGEETVWEIRAVFVEPSLHRRGVAAALMLDAERYAARNGGGRIRLSSSVTAAGFYKKMGFTASAGQEGPGEDGCIQMEKDLK